MRLDRHYVCCRYETTFPDKDMESRKVGRGKTSVLPHLVHTDTSLYVVVFVITSTLSYLVQHGYVITPVFSLSVFLGGHEGRERGDRVRMRTVYGNQERYDKYH